MIDWSATDALIFDMDGTLWDAVDSYCEIWNTTFRTFGVDCHVGRSQLVGCMGQTLDVIYRNIAGDNPVIPATRFIPVLVDNEKAMMPRLAGIPYPHIGIAEFVTESVTFGATKRQKDANMRYLKEKHNLVQPVYVGDTESDCRSTHAAGLPFVFASYGFGDCVDADLTVASFRELTEFFLNR